MLGFLLLLLLLFILWPMLRGAWRIYRQMRDMRRFMNDPASYFSGAAGQRQAGYRPQQPAPQRHKKKIDPDVGEYVEFTEYASTTVDDNTSEVKYRREEQVTDIEWEDVK